MDFPFDCGFGFHTVRCIPLNGGSYVPLPKFLATKKALVKIKNSDNQCFKRCVARALNLLKHKNKLVTGELKKQVETLSFDETEFPVS